jgi:hypothetical protein
MLAGTSWEAFARLKQAEQGAALIAGAYNRPLNVRYLTLVVDTEANVNTVDIQTPSIFVDIRIPTDRPNVSGTALSELTLDELVALSKQHCFAGYSVIEHDVAGYESYPVCNRFHAIDMQPTPRLYPNQWRVQPAFEHGGWVEFGACHMSVLSQAAGHVVHC